MRPEDDYSIIVLFYSKNVISLKQRIEIVNINNAFPDFKCMPYLPKSSKFDSRFYIGAYIIVTIKYMYSAS